MHIKSCRNILISLLLSSLATLSISQEFEDVSNVPHIFTSFRLPSDEEGNILERYMPSVGNGHVATNIRSNTVYVNGLYNGAIGESHRARIPSQNNIIVSHENLEKTNETYSLILDKGYFLEQFFINNYKVEIRTFAHRYYTRLIVTQIHIEGSGEGLTLDVKSDPGPDSDDITFTQLLPINSSVLVETLIGQTKLVEDERYGTFLNVAVMYSKIPEQVEISASETDKTISFIGAYGFKLTEVEPDFQEAAALIANEQHNELFTTHTNAWTAIWDSGSIEIEGNLELAKAVYGSFYYILSSLPTTESEIYGTKNQFYGLSPGGLAYGDLLKDYQGHSFWDTEIWMYPTMLYFYPETAKEMLSYRLHVIQGARDRANETGFEGSRFPWESALTGREVTPDCCPETRDLQIHITGDIAYALRQYVATTRDVTWLKFQEDENATSVCQMIREMAQFWQSRAAWNATTRFYDITNVMPPDEDNYGVDNNGYTNIIAGYTIFFAKSAECLCDGAMEEIPTSWLNMASSLKLLYDEELDFHPEYENYQLGTIIKQADVVLMGFPLQYDMNASTRANDLLIYSNVTRDTGPAMTWAMHTIGYLDVEDETKAEEMFYESFRPYVRQPYKIWTEARPPTLGAVNFITGMGGFLQAIVSGYGGYRLFPEHLVFKKPRLPPQTTTMTLHGLKYLGNTFDVQINSLSSEFHLIQHSDEHNLYFTDSEGVVFPFDRNNTIVTFEYAHAKFPLTLASPVPTNCPLPKDRIGERMPASDPGNGSAKFCLPGFKFLIALALLISNMYLTL